ncbi:hypothetical protein ELH55_34240 (plasmid) [Rhizobium ruizarguesonis]|uniref:Uncharacterized protein n=1 Tax=Rhizobium leguminosarum TaxID=384 RepID=A0A2K9ZCV6_RHILE|nr:MULTISPECIES: hypothetical protein [Rhizobium]AUW45881.1 membrane protein of unknown function [Rhizobium leguminosarum]TBA94350.1 hypothetical protein ELH55_34240 [Rhizobium ruizarguesonis]
MSSALLPGLRNLRVALLIGSLLLGSLYIIFGHGSFYDVKLKDSALEIVHLTQYMPILLVALSCVLIGSLFMTGLEGVVDTLHRNYVAVKLEDIKSPVVRRIVFSFTPFSESARKRIRIEAERFYLEFSPDIGANSAYQLPPKDAFVDQVLREVLWLDGKLAGTPLQAPYDQFRSEGEIRLGTALMLPLAACASAYAMNLGNWAIVSMGGVSSLLAILLGDYGLYYFRRAHSFLAHHIADGKLLAPSMETLKRVVESALAEKAKRTESKIKLLSP